MKKILTLLICVLTYFFIGLHSSLAVIEYECGETLPTDKSQLKEYVDSCTAKLNELSGQKKTLAETITYLNTQISLTQAKIVKTQSDLNDLEIEITDLTGKISSIDYSLTDLTRLFVARVRETYMSRETQLTNFVAQTSGLPALLRQLEYTKSVRDNDRNILVALEKSRLDYNAQKEVKEKKQKEVEALKTSLNQQKITLASQVAAKNKLLTETKNSEVRYQQLKSQAQAQLNSLAGYAESVGVSLLPHQDLSDGWGKYYNQRDIQWGALLVNGDTSDCRGGACTLARIGCLVTSYAMVVSHFGGSLLPSDIAINSSNFSLSSADFNNPGPDANGHSVSRVDNPSIQQLKDALNSGKTVIAGMSRNGGPYPTHYSDHWVVLRSVDGDSFRINDPVYPSAMNASLIDHYAGWTIIQARIYD